MSDVKQKKRRYRKHKWYNTSTGEIEYGIQILYINETNRKEWLHLCDGINALIFKNEIDVIDKIKELKK